MSRRDRERDQYASTYYLIADEQKGRCGICHAAPMTQLAHRIPQSKPMLRKYGSQVINHRRNLVGVCCLACNDKASISNHPLEIDKLVTEIRKEMP